MIFFFNFQEFMFVAITLEDHLVNALKRHIKSHLYFK